jgi:hypothetical protein
MIRESILKSESSGFKSGIKKSMAFNLSKYLKKSKLSDVLDLVNIFLSIFFTFAKNIITDENLLMYIYTFGAIFFLGHYLIEFYTAEQKLYFILSIRSAIECFTLLLPLLFWSNFMGKTTFLFHICPVMRIIATNKAEKLLLRYVNSTAPYLFRIVHSFVCLTIILAALMQYVEEKSQKRDYYEWVYFMIVTISLVGFGDVYPETDSGQFLVILTILIVLIKLPSDIQRYRRASSFIPREALETSIQRKFQERPFVIVLGLEKMRSVRAFLKEFYHEDHGRQDTYCIFMMKTIEVEQVRNLERNYDYYFLLKFIKADPRLEANLAKVKAEEAQNILIASESDNELSDDQNILYYLSLKAYLNKQEIQLSKSSDQTLPNLGNLMEKVYIQLDVPEQKHVFQTITPIHSHKIICVEELKNLMLGKTMFCPGIITLISSLITSMSIDSLPKKLEDEFVYEKNLFQYLQCTQTELYRVPVDGKRLTGVQCKDLVSYIYELRGDLMIAVIHQIQGVSQISLCNLDSFLDPSISHVYLISDEHPDPDKLFSDLLYDSLEKSPNYELIDHDSVDPASRPFLGEKLHFDHKKNDMYYQIENLKFDFNKSQISISKIEAYDEIFESLTNHVIIIGMKPYMRDIIRILRLKSLPRVIPILILYDKLQHTAELQHIAQYQSVYIFKEMEFKASFFAKCKLDKALGVILLRNSSSLNSLFADGESIFIYNQLKKINPDICIVSEFSNISSLNFIMKAKSSLMSHFGHQVSPQFASGEIFFKNFFDSLIVQTVYHPNIISIILKLLIHSSPGSNNHLLDVSANSPHHSNASLYMLKMPSKHDGISFEELFEELIKKSIQLIGIYRSIDSSEDDVKKSDFKGSLTRFQIQPELQ